MYAPYMAFSSAQGAITSQQAVTLVIVFSEAVSGLTASNFQAGLLPQSVPCVLCSMMMQVDACRLLCST